MPSARSAFIRLLLAIGVLAAAAPPASLAQDKAIEGRKRVLFLYDEDKDSFPGLARIDRSLRESFQSQFGNAVDFYSESLELSQFQKPGHDRMMADHYKRKYAGKPPDLIVAVLEPSLDFLVRYGEELFPGVPIVFCGVDASTLAVRKLRPNITGVLVERSFSPTLDVALRLQPRTKNVFVVGGASTFNRYLESLVRRDLKPYETRISVSYLVALPMDALLDAVARLPPNSVIVFTTFFRDGAGRAFVPHEALASIAAAANAPVYVALDQYVGTGAVGGNVYSVESQGTQAAEIGAQIIRGALPLSVPIREIGAQVDMFDARQLKRWGLDEARLPAGSVVLFREPSAWQQYRWSIAATIAVVLLQSALIAGLLLARGRRRRAEAEALRQREELAHVLRVTTLGELTSSLAHEISQPLGAIALNAHTARQLMGGDAAQAKEAAEALTDISADAHRAAQIIQRLRALFRKEHIEQVPVDVNALVEEVVGLLHSAMLTRRIDVRLVLAPALPAVVGDPVQLQQVVLNVVMNACEAIDVAGDGVRVITIRTHQPRHGRLALEIIDSGVGAEQAELERMFEHFVSTKPQGLGMGLAISRSIIVAQGGRIWATANADRGLTMHIELPCSEAA